MSSSEATATEPKVPAYRPPLYLVVRHADFSGSEVFEDRLQAVEVARDFADSLRQQVAVYCCQFDSVAIPVRSEVMVRP
jgi:hypothetical protein